MPIVRWKRVRAGTEREERRKMGVAPGKVILTTASMTSTKSRTKANLVGGLENVRVLLF